MDAIGKISISKATESRTIMPASLSFENQSNFDLVTSEFPAKRNKPTSLELGEETFLPRKQQSCSDHSAGGPHIESAGPTTKQQLYGGHDVGGPSSGFVGPSTKQQSYGAHGVGGPRIGSVGPTSGKGLDDAAKNMGHSYHKGYFSLESFGNYQEVMAALSKPVSSYSLLYESPSVHKPPHVPPKRKHKAKTKTIKSVHRFPKNVKDLTGTGMFDGVPVRYVLSTVEKLRGTIQGEVYLCGCDSCHNSKTYTADDFEHHANCKTSHANNHIRFMNGKTIHQVVKELQGTKDDELFDLIQTITGSPINQEAFRAWKESYQAAKVQTQELHL